jgi:ribonuclease HII
MASSNPSIPPALARDLATVDHVCGSDEVGLGCWAGSLVVCAVVAHRSWAFPGVTDSKKLTPAAREQLYPRLTAEESLSYNLVEFSAQEIDEMGVGVAWKKAHSNAIQGALDLHESRGHSDTPLVIVDGNRGLLGALALPKADLLIPAVSAASIIAKVYRDRLMKKLDAEYPGYGFSSHVGYGTKQHQRALSLRGVCPIHRMSYAPMKFMRKKTEEDPGLTALGTGIHCED